MSVFCLFVELHQDGSAPVCFFPNDRNTGPFAIFKEMSGDIGRFKDMSFKRNFRYVRIYHEMSGDVMR